MGAAVALGGDVDSADDSTDEDVEYSELGALGHVVDGAVESMSADADSIDEELSWVDAADTPEELCQVLESTVRKSTRARAEPMRLDL
jgi:hypothetical protein